MPMFVDASISQDRETISVTSKSRKYSTPQFIRHRWHSRYSYFSSMMVASCSLYYFEVQMEDNTVQTVNFFMLLVTYIITALPMYYMQVLIGQYTQMGVILLRCMCPIAHGVVIGFMVLLVGQSVRLGIYFADFLTYFMHSFQFELEWLTCPKNYSTLCWNNQPKCDHSNCLNPGVFPSTLFYYSMVYLETRGTDQHSAKATVGSPSLHRSTLILILWASICFLVNFAAIRFRKMIIKIWTFTVILLVINVLNVLLRGYNVDVILDIIIINTTALTDFEAWCKAINAPIALMGLGKGVHMMHGSYLEFGETWEGISILAAFINFGVMCMFVSFGRGCLFFLKREAHMDSHHLSMIWSKGTYMYFIAIPMALSLYRIPQLWNMLYFLMCLLMITGNLFLYVSTMEKTFCDAHPRMVKYSRYISCLICISIALISCLLSAKYFKTNMEIMQSKLIDAIELSNTFLFSVCVCWIYGVQKFCDDIHYMRGSQPAKFWKVSWYCMPVILGISYFYTILLSTTYSSTESWLLMACMLPLPICALYEMFRFIRRKNISGLLQSEEQFGPPDPKERYLRRRFNPRAETKLKRRCEICNHKCLLHSRILKRAITEETSYKKSYGPQSKQSLDK